MITYRIEASFGENREWASTPEVLGDAYCRDYATLEEALDAADDLQQSLAEYDLDPTTVYDVVERYTENKSARDPE